MKRPVLAEVLERYKATLLLTASALLLSTVGGIALGVAAAARANSLLDRLSAVASLFGASMPVFWLGIVLMVIFSLWLGWLPASGMFAPYGGEGLWDLLAHLVLPAVTLAAASVTIIARLTRSAMLEVLSQDYVRTARAKGAGEWAVVVRHALKNALIPITTVVGVQAGYLLSGAVLTETVFAWPGLGTLVDNSDAKSFKVSSAVRFGRTVSSISFSRNAASYLSRPRLRSQPPISMMAS